MKGGLESVVLGGGRETEEGELLDEVGADSVKRNEARRQLCQLVRLEFAKMAREG